jgi:cell division septation protein DedD
MGKIAYTGALMATGEKRGGDMVLGGRHLAGIFVALVVLFAAVFTLGYILGKNQYGVQLQAAASTVPPPTAASAEKPSAAKSAATEEPAVPPAHDWDFYHSAEAAQPSERLTQPPKTVAAAKAPVNASPPNPTLVNPATASPTAPASAAKPTSKTPVWKSPNSANSPLIPRGAIVLQVAALDRQGDALALAQALQQKKYPAFVLNPSADHFYRVQVGPYADTESASIARHKLESQGFKSIVKR